MTLCSMLLIGQSVYAAQQDSVSQQLDAADVLMGQGKPLPAARIYYKQWQKDQRCVRCAYRLVEAYKRMDRLADAATVLQNIAGQNPKDLQAWLLLCDAYKGLNDISKYQFTVGQCYARFPNDKRVQVLHTDMMAAGQSAQKSLPRSAVLRQSPKQSSKTDDYTISLLAAHSLRAAGKYKEAIEKLKYCMTLRRDEPDPYLLLDYTYMAAGDLDNALKTRKEFLLKFPNHANARSTKERVDFYSTDYVNIKEQEKQGYQSDSKYSWSTDQMPLEVYINNRWKGRTVSIEPQRNNGNAPKTYAVIIEECLNAWSTASGSSVRFRIVESPEQANIQIDSTTDSSKLHHSFSAGEAGFGTNQDGERTRTIYILTERRETGQPFSEDVFREICLHEIGHALGLAHSANPGDVMYPQVQPKPVTSLSDNDVSRIRRLYQR